MTSTDANTATAQSQPGGDKRTERRANASGNGNGERRRRGIQIGLLTLGVISAVTFAYWFWFMRGLVFTEDARFGGHLVDLAPEINGRVVEIGFHEGQSVHRGDVVFRLDDNAAKAVLAEAEAALVSARANVASSSAKYDKAVHGNRPEEIRAAAAIEKRLANEETLARVSYERARQLFNDGSAAQDELDRAQAANESARQNHESAVANLAVLEQGSRPEDIASAQADLELARSRVLEAAAAVEHARTDLEHCIVRAPFDGWVVRRWLDPGAMTPPSQPVVTLFDPSTLRVDANIEERYLHDVQLGDAADISVDAFPALRLQGRVTDILRATNSQFSLIPAEGVSGTFIKVTQRVPLRISVSAPRELPLGAGMSVEVKIHVGSAAQARGVVEVPAGK